MKTKKIVIATHGTLASGFKSALDIIVRNTEVTAIDCYTNPDFNMDKKVQEILDSTGKDQELYVFTDLLGGSVNNAFMKKLDEYSFHLITNNNLSILMDFMLSNLDIDALRTKVNSDVFKPVICNDLLQNAGKFEEDL